MLQAVLITEPGSGGTSFTGLFYLAQTRITTERPDEFRFSAPPESIQRLSSLYQHLVAGEFPAPLAPEDAARIRFEMAYNPPGHGRLFHRGPSFEPRYRAECRWVRAGLDAVARTLEGGPAEPGVLSALSGCTVPIFVLDPRRPDPPAGGPPATSSLRDDALARVVRELGRIGGISGITAKKRLRPVVVFTKLDDLPDAVAPMVRRSDILDDTRLAAVAPRLGRALLESVVPRSATVVRTLGATVDEPVAFLSYVRAVSGAGGAHLATRTLPDHRSEPVYPFPQFRAMVDHLGALAEAEA
jgi:hypothetical protein